MSSNNHRPTARIIDILEALSNSDTGYTLTELAEVIDAPKSTIFPIVHTLADRNYISIDKDSSKYYIGISSYALGASYFGKKNIMNYINSEMKKIVNSCSETCQLGILDKQDVLYIGKVDSPESIRLISNVGKKLPANCSALGKALLCGLNKDQLADLFPNNLRSLTEKTVTNLDTLYEQLCETRKTGLAVECEESMSYIKCIAAPIRKFDKIVAAISVSIPLFRVSEEKITAVKELLTNASRNIQFMIEKLDEDIRSPF